MKHVYLLLTPLLLFMQVSFAQNNNTVYGNGAGENITTGKYNSIFGDSAGFNMTTRSGAVLIGPFAGHHLTTGSTTWNVNNGFSGTFGPTSVGNVFIGFGSGYSTTTGGDNVFIGLAAGYSNTGSDNTFIGSKAGANNTSGFDNVFVGEESGMNNTNGTDNVFVGEDTGKNNTTGYDNTFTGNQSGNLNTTGFRNAFYGNMAGWDNTTGHRNTFIGDSAGIDNSVGIYNTFIGQGSGAATEHTSYNTFVGAKSGWDNNRTNTSSASDATHNTYLGYRSGFNNREGSYNVVLGSKADFTNVGYSGNNNNVLIGYDSKIYNQVSDNVVIGSNSQTRNKQATAVGKGVYINRDNSIAIGYNTSVDTETAGGYAVAIGAGVNADCKNCMVLGGDNAVNRVSVGIGTSQPNPNATLHLAENNKGFLITRMSDADLSSFGASLSQAEKGMMVYDSTNQVLNSWNGSAWENINSDNQELNLSNDTLSIDGAINTIDLSKYLDNTDTQDLSFSGTTLSLTDGGSVNLSSLQDGTGTDDQELSIANDVLSIEGATNTVDLSKYLDNTDNQDLSLTGTTLSLTNGGSVDLSSLQDGTGTDNQELSIANDVLSIEGATNTVDLSKYLDNTDNQDLSLAGTTLSLTNGGSVNLSSLQDGTGTDAQELELTGTTLSISNGNSVDFAQLFESFQNQLNDLTIIVNQQQNQINMLLDSVYILTEKMDEIYSCACDSSTTNIIEINELPQNELFDCYPNPMDEETTIEFYVRSGTTNNYIRINDINGQQLIQIPIANQGLGSITVTTKLFPSGTYFYSLIVENTIINTKQMIVQ